MTKEKKTKNYILSNNVVINLAGLISKRKSSSKTKSIKKDTQEKQESTAIGRTTPFNNISNLDTQIQQANLRVAENRFQNSSRLPSDTSRTIETSSPQFYTTSLPDDRFREGNSYYNPNDNAGAFGTIEGSDSFQAQGNNIPMHEQNNDVWQRDLNTLLGNHVSDYNDDNYSLRSGSDITYGTIFSDSSDSYGNVSSVSNDVNSQDNRSTTNTINSDESIILPVRRKPQPKTPQPKTPPDPTLLKYVKKLQYGPEQIKFWLENGKDFDPNRPLIRPTKDGRTFRKINDGSVIYRLLMNHALEYGLL
jgi:hypothetical protein